MLHRFFADGTVAAHPFLWFWKRGLPMKKSTLALFAGLLLGALPSVAQEASEKVPLLVTVDDLPMTRGSLHEAWEERVAVTEGMLAVLKKHDIKAVGLVTWGNLRDAQDQELLARWRSAGHELGNHTDQHLDLSATPVEEWIADAEAGRVALTEFLATRPEPSPQKTVRFFRFPYLREGDTEAKLDAVRRYLEETGQRNLPVTLDNQDWAFEVPWVEATRRGDAAAREAVARDYQASLRHSIRGYRALGERLFGRPVPQILLLHGGAVGAAQWDALFSWLEEDGYRFATADEVLADPAFQEAHRYVAERGASLWDRLLDQRRREAAERGVEETLQLQAAAWNRGDLLGFCAHYAEDAAFVSPSGLTRGRDDVLRRYRARYKDRSAMGQLSLEAVELRLLHGTERSLMGDARPGAFHGASLVARWTLHFPDRPDAKPATGLTLLVMRPRRLSVLGESSEWEIIQDASM
jgi:peptidoglycan/xylan/chitin deacetylase (PgdA/CDA1 family)